VKDKKYCPSGDCLDGVHCEVAHCVYNDNSKCACMADSISVGPHGAECTEQTVCSTFAPKE